MKTTRPLTKKDLYDMEQGYNVISNYIVNNQYYLITEKDNIYSLINTTTKETIYKTKIDMDNHHNIITSIFDNFPSYDNMWNGEYLKEYDNQYCVIMIRNEDNLDLIHLPSNKKITFKNVEGDLIDMNNYEDKEFSLSIGEEIFEFTF